MKVAVIGAGAVGTACIMSIITRGVAREIVVIEQNAARAQGVVTDMQYGTPLCEPVVIRTGDYDDLPGVELILVSVGINEKAGGAMDRNDPAGRLRLLDTNARIVSDVVSKVIAVAPSAVILIITNPPEPLAELARRIAGHDQVLSAGTFLDTLRFRFHLARQLGVHASEVEAQVVGEHGNSRVLLWSTARVGGRNVLDLLEPEAIPAFRAEVEEQVRNANLTIIEGIGASQYGIGMACGRIAQAMARDEHIILPLGSHVASYGTTLSLPTVVGRRGAVRAIMPDMSAREREALAKSAETLRTAFDRMIASDAELSSRF
jgi:L-lactate dehydrogenase